MIGAAVRLDPAGGGVPGDLSNADGALLGPVAGHVPDPFETLAHRHRDGQGDALTRGGRELTRQPFGFLVLDVQAHVRNSTMQDPPFFTIAESTRADHGAGTGFNDS